MINGRGVKLCPSIRRDEEIKGGWGGEIVAGFCSLMVSKGCYYQVRSSSDMMFKFASSSYSSSLSL
jgi:hypothetical protein